MKTAGFHHITMVSSDAPRTLIFYRDLLGFDLVKITVNHDDPSAYHLYFGLDGGRPGTILTFFEWKHLPRGRFGVGGVHHVALSVSDAEAQLRWKRRLTDAGVRVTGPYDRGYFRSIYFSDPDGQILEIATAGPGYAFDEPADSLGTAVITPDAHRLRGRRDEAAIADLTHGEPVPTVDAGMAITGVHHVSGITDDVERAHEFYEGGLGLSLVKKTVNQDDGETPHWFWAEYDGTNVAPGSSMTLFEWGAAGSPARPGSGQTHHIAFRAVDGEQQTALVERLAEAGVETTPEIDRVYFRSVYFQAPDGQLCEIATDGPGFAVDEPADSLGSRLVLPPWMESNREAIEASLTPLPLLVDTAEAVE
ncbi:MAG: VOC family protein [Gemmatimonadota bacterium]|nr:VOC family protein [Gemmatimonadota bacterium]